MKTIKILLLALFSLSLRASAAEFDCLDLNLKPAAGKTNPHTPTEDFAFRDSLPSTDAEKTKWQTCCGSFGPCPITYPEVVFPSNATKAEWSRLRIVEAAKKLVGTPYAHHHIPEMGGLDCSNFTAFVYNYALGIRFSSNVRRQALEAGRKLKKKEPLLMGDLIYIFDKESSEIAHVVIYLNEKQIIDSTGVGVKIRSFEGWYKDRLAWARRIVE